MTKFRFNFEVMIYEYEYDDKYNVLEQQHAVNMMLMTIRLIICNDKGYAVKIKRKKLKIMYFPR